MSLLFGMFLMTVARCVDGATMQMTTLYFNEERMSWNSALNMCSKYGGLVNIHSPVIQYAVEQLMKDKNGNRDIWIGLHNQGSATSIDWRWSNCEQLQSNWTNWSEDDDVGTTMNLCVLAWRKSQVWETADCGDNLPHPVCAKTEGDCSYVKPSNSLCEFPTNGGKKISFDESETESQCRKLCDEVTRNGEMCWAYEYDSHAECSLMFSSNPYLCVSNEETSTYVRHCFTFDTIQETSLIDDEISTPSLVCDPNTSSSTADFVSSTALSTSPTAETTISKAEITVVEVTPFAASTAQFNVSTATATGSASFPEFPSASFTEFPSASFTEFPSASFTEFPSASFTEFPSASFTEFPSASFTEFRSAGVDTFPDTQTTGNTPTAYSGSGVVFSRSTSPVGYDITPSLSSQDALTETTPPRIGITSNTEESAGDISPTATWSLSLTNIMDSGGNLKACGCICAAGGTANRTIDLDSLVLNKRNLSAFHRRLYSVPDDRPSAKSIGASGVVFLFLSLFVVIAMDLNRLL